MNPTPPVTRTFAPSKSRAVMRVVAAGVRVRTEPRARRTLAGAGCGCPAPPRASRPHDRCGGSPGRVAPDRAGSRARGADRRGRAARPLAPRRFPAGPGHRGDHRPPPRARAARPRPRGRGRHAPRLVAERLDGALLVPGSGAAPRGQAPPVRYRLERLAGVLGQLPGGLASRLAAHAARRAGLPAGLRAVVSPAARDRRLLRDGRRAPRLGGRPCSPLAARGPPVRGLRRRLAARDRLVTARRALHRLRAAGLAHDLARLAGGPAWLARPCAALWPRRVVEPLLLLRGARGDPARARGCRPGPPAHAGELPKGGGPRRLPGNHDGRPFPL